MEILGKILGSTARVKIMRLFLLNPQNGFSKKDIIKRSRVNSSIAGKEIKLLASLDFIKKHNVNWFFNSFFKYAKEFDRLLIGSDSLDKKLIADTFKKVGKVKLLLVSGIFIKNKDTRIDILIVGDKMKKTKIEDGIHKLEAEIGTELVYVVFDTKEFIYRLNMYDKLVRDIIDFPHEVILQAKELSPTLITKKV
ncbi:hypothetical protein AUJ22_00015 [Candidatus Nomurabacteria bacterium CG1_02_31_12]|uniref:Transcriptional regulator n=1 Tax=Candidatus Nomurabacteria bacterium CG1_02_31_12 TaxID=1805280 RepID=A0A1J4V781_9BACT|nr:MAG: hypothetical protein AUJ22_00015 [Candidatus Nomurabacteria bacterium CG1_02_31_12]